MRVEVDADAGRHAAWLEELGSAEYAFHSKVLMRSAMHGPSVEQPAAALDDAGRCKPDGSSGAASNSTSTSTSTSTQPNTLYNCAKNGKYHNKDLYYNN